MQNPKNLSNKKFPSVPLRLRIGHDSQRRHAEPVYSANGKPRPLWCWVDGKQEHHPEGVYYLRVKGRRWIRVGKDARLAITKQCQYAAKRQADDAGLSVAAPELADVDTPNGTLLKEAVERYLANVKKLRAHKTYLAYRRANELFAANCKARIVESISNQDIFDHLDYLCNELQMDERTVANHYDFIGIMLRTCGVNLSSLLKRNEKPTYEDPIVEQPEMKKLIP